MKKGFPLLNIIILASVLLLVFVLYKDYNNQKDNFLEISNINEQNSGKDIQSPKGENQKENYLPETKPQEKASALPNPSTLPKIEKTIESSISSTEEESSTPGYFLNEKYNYQIIFPMTWRIQKDYLEEITIGTIPPKNGQGAMKFKIINNPDSEINTMKKTVKEYPEILELEEKEILVDNITADELILINKANNTNTYYIFLSNKNINYMISYTYASEGFYIEAQKVIDNFKFISK